MAAACQFMARLGRGNSPRFRGRGRGEFRHVTAHGTGARTIHHQSHKEKSMDIDTGLETKAGVPHDAVVTHGELMRAFEAFKETTEARLATRTGDVVLEEKLARIDGALDAQARRLDEITLKAARPALGHDRVRSGAPEHKAAFA